MKITLSKKEEEKLLKLHKFQKKKYDADSIKTILLLNKGYLQKEVAELLFLDEDTISNYKYLYLKKKDINWFRVNYKSYIAKLSYVELSNLHQYTDIFKVTNKS